MTGPQTSTPLIAPDLAWAAYLVSGWWGAPGAPPQASPEPEAILKRLRNNGFPLLTLVECGFPQSSRLDGAGSSAAELLAAAPFRLALQQDRAKMLRQQAAFAEVVDAWQVRGIPALFVKAMGPRPSFPYVSNNLDVLVPQAQQHAARQIVRDLGYVELRHIEEPNKFLFRRFDTDGGAFDLHIHGRLEWHTEFVDSAAAFRRASRAPESDLTTDHGAFVPAPEDGLLIALAHAAYENKAYKLIELAKFVYAARVLHVDWDRVAAGAAARGWLTGMWAILASLSAWERQLYGTGSLPEAVLRRVTQETPTWLVEAIAARFSPADQTAWRVAAPVRIPFVESKRLFYAKMLADPSQARTARAREIWTHTLYGTRVRLRLRSQRPMLVALDGIDGCGKSAQAALLANALDGAALRHRVVWTRGGSSRLLQPLFALGRRLLGPNLSRRSTSRTPSQTTAAREQTRTQLFTHPLVRQLWPWAIALELAATWTLRVRWPLLRGEVVVADRYIDSALVELAARLDRPDIACAAPARLLQWLAPRPAFSYWLDLPVEVALARKDGDESAAFLAKQVETAHTCIDRRGMSKLAATGDVTAARVAAPVRSTPATQATCLDATVPMAELSVGIAREVLLTYEDRHWTLLNALFCANPRPLERR